MSSLVSAKGPSRTVLFSPEKRTRLPLLLGWRPSAANIMPAFTSASLNLPISAKSFSLGITPASEFLVALTITMTRIALLLSIRRDLPYFSRDEQARAGSTHQEPFLAVGTAPHTKAPSIHELMFTTRNL